MDITITKKKKHWLKRYWFLPLLLIPLGYAVNYLWNLSQAGFSVNAKTMVVAEVTKGDFTVSVRGTGLLVADDIQWLATTIDARVEKLIVKAGKKVKKGELIVLLSNPQLIQSLEETQWELEALEAETKANQVAQESNLLDKKASLLNVKLNYESSQLRQTAQAELYKTKSGAVSRIDYESTRLETIQLKQRWEINQQQVLKMQENIKAQNHAHIARLNKMRKTLERVQHQVDSLKVIATMDSVVQEVPLEPGQQITVGTNIAKLAREDSLIAELQVAELQIRDVAIGQKVIIDTRNNKITGTVTRVDPAVNNGNVQVDVAFSTELPLDARPDLTVDGEIMIAEFNDTLQVERPLFSQSQSTASLYRLTDGGDFAERITVVLGKGSVNRIQIIDGLEVGDKVIVSDPTSWDSYKKIRIN